MRATKRSRIDKADHVICCLVSELKRYGTTTGTAPFAKVHFKVLITLSRSVEAVQAGSGMWSQHACLARRPRGICAPSEVEFIARDRMDMIARYLERRAKTATPCASDSEPLCEAYPGSRSLVQKSLSPQAAPPAVGFRKSLRAGRFLCERFSQANSDGERVPISTPTPFMKHIALNFATVGCKITHRETTERRVHRGVLNECGGPVAKK